VTRATTQGPLRERLNRALYSLTDGGTWFGVASVLGSVRRRARPAPGGVGKWTRGAAPPRMERRTGMPIDEGSSFGPESRGGIVERGPFSKKAGKSTSILEASKRSTARSTRSVRLTRSSRVVNSIPNDNRVPLAESIKSHQTTATGCLVSPFVEASIN